MTVLITVDPGHQFAANLALAESGLVGTLRVQVVEPGSQRVVIPWTVDTIHEFPVGSGEYGVDLVAPLAPGLYAVVWDFSAGNPPTPLTVSVQQLAVSFEPPRFPDWDPWGWSWLWSDFQREISSGGVGSNPIPSAADVRAASNVCFDEFGYADDMGPHGLQEIVDRAESVFYNVTGQTLDQIVVKFAPQVRRVVQGITEYLVMQQSQDYLDTLTDWDLIQTFSAGPYSETRRSATEMFQARMLFPVPWISQALWGLLTPERYAFWISFFTNTNVPAWSVSETFWEAGATVAQIDGPPGMGMWWGA